MRNYSKVLDDLLLAQIYINLAISMMALILPYSVGIKLAQVMAGIGIFTGTFSSVFALRHGCVQARFYLVAWSAPIAGMIILSVKAFGFLPDTFLTNHAMQIGGALEVLLLSFGLAFRIRILQKAKDKAEVEVGLSRALEESYRRVEAANVKLNEWHTMIHNSVECGMRLQQAMLPTAEDLEEPLLDYFFLWQPRDGVGGDLIYFYRSSKGSILAVIDGTGHGVPGAMLSILTKALLDRAVVENESNPSPGSILKSLEKLFVKTFHSEEKTAMLAGAAVSICLLEPSGQLTFAGAGQDLMVAENGELREIKGTRSSLGYGYRAPETYLETIVEFTEESVFYLYSDGFSHQIGGPHGHPLSRKRMKEIVLQFSSAPLQCQGKLIEEELTTYRGATAQVDDITIFGFRVRRCD